MADELRTGPPSALSTSESKHPNGYQQNPGYRSQFATSVTVMSAVSVSDRRRLRSLPDARPIPGAVGWVGSLWEVGIGGAWPGFWGGDVYSRLLRPGLFFSSFGAARWKSSGRSLRRRWDAGCGAYWQTKAPTSPSTTKARSRAITSSTRVRTSSTKRSHEQVSSCP